MCWSEFFTVVMEKYIFSKWSMYFYYFAFVTPCTKAWLFVLTKFEFLLPKDAWCQVYLKLVQCFLRRFLKVVNLFSLFLNQFESPLPKDVLYQVWLKLALWFCRSWKCGMFTTMTENRQIFRKATCNLSLWLRWAKEVNLSTEHNLCKLISQIISESCFYLSLESWDKL